MIKIKRVYDAVDQSDGYRVLVDRLWARGLTKEKAKVDLWLKDIAPSTELRNEVHHNGLDWASFKSRYRHELIQNSEATKAILKIIEEHNVVTFLYASKDEVHNNADVLKSYLEEVME